MGSKSLRGVRVGVSTLAIFGALMVVATPAWPDTSSAFGVESFSIAARNADGTLDELAGTHPFSLEVHLAVEPSDPTEPGEALRQAQVSLPPGLTGNPLNVPRCSAVSSESCSAPNQIGILQAISTGFGQVTAPIYNVVPPPGYLAAFAVTLNGKIRLQLLRQAGPGGAVRITTTLPPESGVTELDEQIWGVPAEPGHDSERICESQGSADEGCSSGARPLPLLTLPGSCSAPIASTLVATSSGPSPVTAVATAVTRDAAGNPSSLSGCGRVPFEPRLLAQSERAVSSPSALAIGVEVPQYEAPYGVAAATLGRLDIDLPDGFAFNPAAGSWLTSCSAAAVGLQSSNGVQPATFDETPVECPASARLGSVRVQTPSVDHELQGGIYFAAGADNPFGSRYALYLTIEDRATGTVLKIPARLDVNPRDGHLTATISELPQLPFGELELEFNGGPRAPLASPSECGRYLTEATFTPSTVPFREPVTRSAAITIDRGPGGTACPTSEAGRNAIPALQAGTTNPVAGANSPLVMRLSRDSADQQLGAFGLTLPPGLIANLGSTPIGAEVGSARVEAGVGPDPLSLTGAVYLGGQYEGAPYSLTIVVPSQAGPFDLGTIVERVAVDFDPATAQVEVHADPLPQILEGVPLQLRAIRLDLDRPGFIRNPTNCEPMSIDGTATSSLGQTVPISTRFQVGECARIGFAPKASIEFSGALGRNGHPALRTALRLDPSGAALKQAAFLLPAGELLDLRHLGPLCPREKTVGRCPPSSRLGSIRLASPFLAAPLEGAVFLRVPQGRHLPALSAELASGRFSLEVSGRTTSSAGRLGARLESLPDIPLSSAVLSFAGGRRGIFVNSHSLCRKRGLGRADLSGHNGMRRELRVPVRVEGCH